MGNIMSISSWKYFSLDELKCKCGECGSTGLEMDNAFMQVIIMLRQKINSPFKVTSAYRCHKYNNQVSTTGLNGPHTTGKAIDIGCRNETALHILREALYIQMPGIGVNQKGDGRFIHLDMCSSVDKLPRPNIWSY
jgi:zinc D-Ala-D-Ala carboxypeptidase